MLTKERRPFTEAERERVRVMLAATYQGQGFLDRAAGVLAGLVVGGLVGAFLVFVPVNAWNWLAGLLHGGALSDAVYVILLSVGAGAGMVWAAWLMFQNSQDTATQLAEERRKFQQDLDEGEVEVWRCEALRVVHLEESEGPGFFLELGPGQTLFLQGQYLYDFVEDEDETGGDGGVPKRSQDPNVWPPAPRIDSADGYQFPCRRFDLLYAPHSRGQLDLVCLSQRFEDWPTYSPGPESTWEDVGYPEDGDVLPVSLDTLEADLNRWAAQQVPPKD